MSLKIESVVKIDSDPCVLAWDNNLFVGTEDGSIKIFEKNLTSTATWSAHGVQLFALAAGNAHVYSTSNDGGVRVWSIQGKKITELPFTGGDIGVLRVFGKNLYAGDEIGNVVVYENNTEKARYNLLEEVKDIELNPPLMFTVRDLNVTVTEIKPDESKNRFTTRHTMEGRAPLRVAGSRLLVTTRSGNNLRLHDISPDTKFKMLHEVKVSDMILTSLTVSDDYAWTGGWDNHIRRWKITDDRLEPAGDIDVGACINALISCAPDNVYAALAGGQILRVEAV